jgi:hypothetical protein
MDNNNIYFYVYDIPWTITTFTSTSTISHEQQQHVRLRQQHPKNNNNIYVYVNDFFELPYVTVGDLTTVFFLIFVFLIIFCLHTVYVKLFATTSCPMECKGPLPNFVRI